MDSKFIVLACIVALLAVSIVVGIWYSKKVESSQAFLGATKMFGPALVSLSAVAAMASGNAMVGTPASIYAGNNVQVYWMYSSCIFAMSYFIIGKKMRAMAEVGKVATLGDICDLRFHSRWIKGVMSLVLFMGSIAYLAAQLTAASSMFTYLLGWDVLPAALLVFGIVTLYTIFSGEVGGIMTQAIQGVILFVGGFIIIVMFFMKVGGFGNVLAVVSEAGTVASNGVEKVFSADLVSAYGTVGSGAILAAFFIPILGTMGQPQTLTRMYALKDPRDMPRMGLMTGLLHMPVALTSICIAFTAMWMVGSREVDVLTSDSISWAVGDYMGIIPQICLYTAIIAAILSSSSMYLQAAANFISHDFPNALGVKFDDKKQITVTRICMASAGIIVILLTSFSKSGTSMLTTFGWGTLMSGTFPVIIVGMLWKKANKTGVACGITFSLIGNIVCFLLIQSGFTFPGGLPWYVIVIAIAVAISVFVSLLTYKPERDKLDAKVEAVLEL